MLIYLKSEVLNMEKNNIVLIGMPGVGKSTIGVILAKVLGFKFIDTDLIIQEKEQGQITQLLIAVLIGDIISLAHHVGVDKAICMAPIICVTYPLVED